MTIRRVVPLILLASLVGAATPIHAESLSETCPPESCVQLGEGLYLDLDTSSKQGTVLMEGDDCVLLDLNQLLVNLKNLGADLESIEQLINPIGGTYSLSCIGSSGNVYFLGTFPIELVA